MQDALPSNLAARDARESNLGRNGQARLLQDRGEASASGFQELFRRDPRQRSRPPKGEKMTALAFTISDFAFTAVAVWLASDFHRNGKPRMAVASIALGAILRGLATWAACDLIGGI